MDFFQAKEMVEQMHPGKKFELSCDEKCHRKYEIIITDGVANPVHHIENNKVRVDVEGLPPFYVPIMSHRENCTWEYMQNLIKQKST